MSSTVGRNEPEDDTNSVVIVYSSSDSSDNSNDHIYASGDSSDINNNSSSQENFHCIDLIDSDDEKDEFENEKNWSDLPSLAIENIYSFLSRTDQSRMSLVCSRWANVYGSPCIWKTIKFYLPEHEYPSEVYPEVKFVRKYGSMFRHVEIICKRIRTHMLGIIWKQLKFFLLGLVSNSQLVSIKFINMGNYFRHLDDFIRKDVLNSINSFFASQENLRTVVFEDSRLHKEEGMELLSSVYQSNKATLRKLKLRGFVNDSDHNEVSNSYLFKLSSVCGIISTVQNLEIDYTQIFEDILRCFVEQISAGIHQIDKNKHHKPLVNMYCEGLRYMRFQGISPACWKCFANVFPNPRVTVDITIHSNIRNEIGMFLIREMPLKTLDFRFEKTYSSPRVDITSLFDHLLFCKYQDHLEMVNILWMPPIANLASAVIPFLQACKKIQIFHLHAQYISNEIEDILKAMLENHPASLKSITLWFNSAINEEDEYNLNALSEQYYPLLETQGIEIFLLLDPGRRLRRR
ncbi:f-box domain-containing protein [Trichonephila inaurata madagascariensis]|uniref:F-box domain-containing protein n=1 Tax=Trichonephila inaurata madagascariensis TaxID=2747483 RepID=A0A8X6YQ18_9ARAC|nr:f-box domain-containing protein [Trichonephila inaurata madagascariensis]